MLSRARIVEGTSWSATFALVHVSLFTLYTSRFIKVYFASDLHLGVDARLPSGERERLFVRWLDEVVAPDADALYLLGDVFEFWFEYRRVVPRGFVRLLGKLAELRDGGLRIEYFTGNHDLWMGDYFEQELGIPLRRRPRVDQLDGRRFFIGHGDGLGPGDVGYKRMKRVFTNPAAQWAYARLHPNFAVALAERVSGFSRQHTRLEEAAWLGAEREWLALYAERKLARDPTLDYFVFGHRHLPIDYPLSGARVRYVNAGDWLHHQSYVRWDGRELAVRFFGRDGQTYPR